MEVFTGLSGWLIGLSFAVGWTVAGLVKEVIKRHQQPGVKVSIRCKHGTFIPGVHRLGKKVSLYSCDRCDLLVEIRDFKGKVDW